MSQTKSEFPSPFTLFNESIALVLRNKLSFFIISFIPAFLQYLSDGLRLGFGTSALSSATAADTPLTSSLSVTGIVLSILFIPTLYVLALRAVQSQNTNLTDVIRDSLRFFIRAFVITLFLTALVVIGLVLLIVPGVIIIKRYFLAPFFMIDQDVSISQAMTKSELASNGHSLAILGVVALFVLILFIAVLPGGSLISLILMTLFACAPALRYQQLKKYGETPTS